jgi:hypothetical protein
MSIIVPRALRNRGAKQLLPATAALLIAAGLVLAPTSRLEAKTQVAKGTQARNQASAKSTHSPASDICHTLASLRKESDAWKMLNNRSVIKAIEKLTGDDSENFWNCIQCTQPLTNKNNNLFTTGSVMGLSDDRTSFICANISTGKIALGYLIDKVEHVYGAANLQALPVPAAEYVKSLDSSVEVEYERPKHSAHARARVIAKQKTGPALNLDSLTGTYDRPTSRFTSGSLKIQALPDNKIQFAVEAFNGGHTGGANGIIQISDKKAVYKGSEIFADDKGYLNFSFSRGAIEIEGTELPFCGAGVTLNGTYTKVDDKKPTFDEP